MTMRRGFLLVPMVLILATYGYRAAVGVVAGVDFERGRQLYSEGRYREAAPVLDRAAVGFNRLRSLFLAAESRLDRWDDQVVDRGPVGADLDLLVQAAQRYLQCRCIAPASRRSWEGLGEVYDGVEWLGRERRSERPFVPADDPWTLVGRPGRVALGMMRNALELAPNWYGLRDKMALTLWSYGIEDQARQAVRDSARVLPLFYRHRYRNVPDLPDWVLDEFAAASRSAVGQVPLMSRMAHLIDLGKLERRIGSNELAITALEAALEERGDALNRAEARFHLGLALNETGRLEEGQEYLAQAAEHPVFRGVALFNLAGAAERAGRLDLALEHLRLLRRESPKDLDYCLRFAAVARRLRDWPAALESLSWARLIHPAEVRVYVALVETHLEKGDPIAATTVLKQLDGREDAAQDVRRLRGEIRRLTHGN